MKDIGISFKNMNVTEHPQYIFSALQYVLTDVHLMYILHHRVLEVSEEAEQLCVCPVLLSEYLWRNWPHVLG